MNIPIFNVALMDEWDAMLCVSLVEHPAVECNFLVFNDYPKQMFQHIEGDEHKILGVAIRADVPIYRGDYYVRFTKEVIEEIVQRYSERELWNTVSLQHSGENIKGAVLTQYFLKDTQKGINPKGFEAIEEGSLFMEFKITDDKLWDEVKHGNANGFSIEIISTLIPSGESIPYGEDDYSDVMDWFEKVTVSEVEELLSENRQVDIKIGERTLTNQQLFQLGSFEDKDVILTYDPNHKDWTYWDLDKIDDIILTDNPLEDFDFNAKWKLLINDENVIIRTTRPTSQPGKNSIDYIMDRNLYAMVSYNDESGSPATGFRTCFISSWGYTTAKNECIRIYEYGGDTKSGFTEGRWRLLLTRRIMDLKAVDYVPPIKTAPPLYNKEAKAKATDENNKPIRGTMSRVKRFATFPPKITE